VIDIDKLKKTVKVNVDDHSYQKLNEQYKTLLEKKGILLNGNQFFILRQANATEKYERT
jgi:glutathione peroxidase-family protein